MAYINEPDHHARTRHHLLHGMQFDAAAGIAGLAHAADEALVLPENDADGLCARVCVWARVMMKS